jgi:hypothetical protein
MTLTPTDKTTPAIDEVIFFTERGFQGTAYLTTFGARVDIWKHHNRLNDKLVSAKLGESCKLAAYRHAGFGAPIKDFTADTPDIDIGGMSSFIITAKTGEYPVLFTFKDAIDGNRRMTLQSSEFPEGGSVIQPNPDPEPGVDPNSPRVFAILRDTNNVDRPATVAIHVRRGSGEYEDMGAMLLVYWGDGSIRIKEMPEYGHPSLHHRLEGSIIHFEWR